ncbi:unnamed protein product [Urochloa humidicola]
MLLQGPTSRGALFHPTRGSHLIFYSSTSSLVLLSRFVRAEVPTPCVTAPPGRGAPGSSAPPQEDAAPWLLRAAARGHGAHARRDAARGRGAPLLSAAARSSKGTEVAMAEIWRIGEVRCPCSGFTAPDRSSAALPGASSSQVADLDRDRETDGKGKGRWQRRDGRERSGQGDGGAGRRPARRSMAACPRRRSIGGQVRQRGAIPAGGQQRRARLRCGGAAVRCDSGGGEAWPRQEKRRRPWWTWETVGRRRSGETVSFFFSRIGEDLVGLVGVCR